MKEKKELTDKEKDILKIIIALSVLAIFIASSLYSNYKERKVKAEESYKIVSVTDNNRYFTVINCVKKYIDYVANKDTESILLLLNEEYKTEYGINSTNLSNFIPNLDVNLVYDYRGKEMYTRRISKNQTEFYVHGSILDSSIDDSKVVTDYNITVTLYENTLTFSVKPGVEK